MPRKPTAPKAALPAAGGNKGLAVKDSLREVRFNMKQGARKLVRVVEAATQRHDDAAHRPFGLLSEPLNLAVRTTATLLGNVDHAAVDLLSFDGAYRSMTVPLRSSASYFAESAKPADLRTFTTDHYWRYRHWLALNQHNDVFVHEQAIAIAGEQLAGRQPAAPAEPVSEAHTDADVHRRNTVPVIHALMRQDILSRPALSAEEGDDDLSGMAALGAVAIVLAGEIAVRQHLGARDQYAAALRLADEIALADRDHWERAWHSRMPDHELGRWLAFVMRHL